MNIKTYSIQNCIYSSSKNIQIIYLDINAIEYGSHGISYRYNTISSVSTFKMCLYPVSKWYIMYIKYDIDKTLGYNIFENLKSIKYFKNLPRKLDQVE